MKKNHKFQKRLLEILEPANKNDQISKSFDIFIIVLIVINIISVIVSSFKNLNPQVIIVLDKIEFFSVIIFSLEYFLRIITAHDKYPNNSSFISRIKFILSPMAIIDLLAIIPFYLPFIIKIDLRFLRILRLTRILRVLKINRYSNSLLLLSKVIKKKKSELLVTLFITFLLLLLASSAMYFVETEKQPEAFPNIIASFWWAIATLTTVGYGDIYPVTWLGKILSGIIALLGIGIVALPTGILSSGFVDELQNHKNDSYRNIRVRKYKKRKNRNVKKEKGIG